MSEDIRCPNCGSREKYQDEDNKARCEECDEVIGHTGDLWEGEVYGDQSFDLDPCPFCESELFNIRFRVGGQVVGSPRQSLDSQRGEFHVDDYFDEGLEIVHCGRNECSALLFDEDWDEEEFRGIEQEFDVEEFLTDVQKKGLLKHAKRVAVSSFNTLGWNVNGSVQGGIDDAADERFGAGFKGDREIAVEFLENHEDEIRDAVLQVKELPFEVEAPLTGRTIRIYNDDKTPSGKNWEYVEEEDNE